MPTINRFLTTSSGISSKSISQAAKANPAILNLSIGEPDFGPPPHVLSGIGNEDLQLANFIDAAKRYEHSRGDLRLRQAISTWYQRRYGLQFDPEQQILVTHGGMEALNLAILAVTEPGDQVTLADPGYTMYQRAISLLGRHVRPLRRAHAEHEYLNSLQAQKFNSKAVLINSPENPTGYVLSQEDWQAVALAAEAKDSWIIHDEVYDTLALSRQHLPATAVAGLSERSLLINSCSKKFGVPGLRIGWLVGPAAVIEAASKAHESLCLGVNILAERIALRLLADEKMESWFAELRHEFAERNRRSMMQLHGDLGFQWERAPMGGVFLFPNVETLCKRLPQPYQASGVAAGTAVAQYLLQELQISAVPGAAYGEHSGQYIRLTNCAPAQVFQAALDRLASPFSVVS